MRKLGISLLSGLCLLSLSLTTQAARWWNPDDTDYSGGGIDLDSYQNFTDEEGFDITSVWVRGKFPKAESLYNPNLDKKSMTSGFSMLVEASCDSDEFKITDIILQDRQYNDLWQVSDYPQIDDGLDFPINKFFVPRANSLESKMMKGLCKIKNTEQKYGISIQDIQLDSNGHMINH